MIRAQSRLPAGRHFALTWGIADRYGGMTGALLHRSRAFRQVGGIPVDILTLDDRGDYAELEARLRAAGELIDGLRIRNLWDDLRQRPPKPRANAPRPDAVAPLTPDETDELVEHDGVVLVRRRVTDDGKATSVDRFRRDGTLLVTERVVERQRRIVVYAPDGTPLRAWGSSWSLYRWWLDRLTGGKLSYLLVDSKTAARFVGGYRRDHVVTVHIVHGSHRSDEGDGALRDSRAGALQQAANFDAVVVLTDRQRDDLRADLAAMEIPAGRVRVIPNGVDLATSARERHGDRRDRTRGILVASLTARKRVGHALDAVMRAHARDGQVSLDVYGTGEDEAALRERVAAGDAVGWIRLQGFDPEARLHFRRAGFSLLTSSSEGLPLVLVESMAAGCIPIAYDIRYGPADMIRNGRDGFLVADGDVEAMAERIGELQRMPETRVTAMRRRAVARARRFSDTAVTRRWAFELRAARDAKLMAASEALPRSVRIRRRAGILRRRVLWRLGL